MRVRQPFWDIFFSSQLSLGILMHFWWIQMKKISMQDLQICHWEVISKIDKIFFETFSWFDLTFIRRRCPHSNWILFSGIFSSLVNRGNLDRQAREHCLTVPNLRGIPIFLTELTWIQHSAFLKSIPDVADIYWQRCQITETWESWSDQSSIRETLLRCWFRTKPNINSPHLKATPMG